jgi:hypothetical protein
MVWCVGDDGVEGEIPREQLVRIWGWNGSRLMSRLALRDVQEEIMEDWRADGWHAWATGPVVFKT